MVKYFLVNYFVTCHSDPCPFLALRQSLILTILPFFSQRSSLALNLTGPYGMLKPSIAKPSRHDLVTSLKVFPGHFITAD